MRKLLLFDIDGTMLHAHRQGRVSMQAALEQVLGRPISILTIDFSGKTDPQIFDLIMEANGIDPEDRDDVYHAAIDTYIGFLQSRIAERGVHVYEGVRPLVNELAARDDVALGLVTGNVKTIAFSKLEAAALAPFFGFGAFGSDHADRNALPPLAVDRAHRHTGHTFAGEDVVVIGDTPNDIACGKAIGARTVAVCTGTYSREALEVHLPDVLFDDLRDHGAFYDAVF